MNSFCSFAARRAWSPAFHDSSLDALFLYNPCFEVQGQQPTNGRFPERQIWRNAR